MSGRQADEVRLLASRFSGPLEKPVGRDQTPTMFQGGFEGRFGCQGLHSGVDHSRADRSILGPERHQSPMALLDVPGVLELDNDGYFLGGGDVVVGLDLERWG